MNREQRRKVLKKMSRQERKAFKKGYEDIFKKSANEMYTGLESAFEKRWAETGNDDTIDELSKIPNINPIGSQELKQIMNVAKINNMSKRGFRRQVGIIEDETLNEGERSYDYDWSDETESF